MTHPANLSGALPSQALLGCVKRYIRPTMLRGGYLENGSVLNNVNRYAAQSQAFILPQVVALLRFEMRAVCSVRSYAQKFFEITSHSPYQF
jgi:hypothetical protein